MSLSKRQIVSIRSKIKKHQVALGRHRDELRDLIEEVSQITDDADEAISNLDDAADALSRLQ